MPLIIACGYPLSGKSTIIQLLTNALQSKYPEFVFSVIPEPATREAAPLTGGCDPRSEFYADSIKERELRGHHKSEVERALTSRRNAGPGHFVFMDGPNYIKGYRYELYCLAKSLRHPHVVLFCDTPAEVCIAWNKKIDRYPDDLLSDMIARFEAPQSSQRWDNPLLPVQVNHWPSAENIDIGLLLTKFEELLFTDSEGTSVKPNRSTQLAPAIPSNFLQELERAVQIVIDHIIQSMSMGVQTVCLPSSITSSYKLPPDVARTQLSLIGKETQFSMANLVRAKRRYIGFQRAKLGDMTTTPNVASAAAGFLHFLASERI